MESYKGIVFVTLTSLVLGVMLGFYLDTKGIISFDEEKETLSPASLIEAAKIVENSTDTSAFPYLNKTVIADLDKHFIINLKPLRNTLESIQKKYSQKTYVYFDYLNNASWVGLGEKDLFTAASTVKVPLAMAVMKAVEDGKLRLTDTYTLDELDLDSNFGDLYKAGSDKSFTLEELMGIMLVNSDNTAKNALYKVLNNIGMASPLDEVYTYMGWDFNQLGQDPSQYQDINLKTLSNMFIALYNAKYISTEHSNKILNYLAHTPFDDKIARGVPKEIQVAHKIGIADNNKTFSDCGIVYAPNRHYILCAGSNGGDEKKADAFMSEISSEAFKFVMNN